MRLVSAALIAGVSLLIAGCGGGSDSPSQTERSQAIGQAIVAFHQVQASGRDLSAGPCISESLPGLPDWVADIAHDPRQPVDDQQQNQCQRYRSGQAHHFVELTPTGELIRAQ
jgi:hypothetical protein